VINPEPAELEQWYRDVLPARLDISSSGVYPFTLRELLDIGRADIDEFLALAVDDTTSLGSWSIRQTVADIVGGGDPSRVLVANGSSEALFLVLSTVLSPDDEVIVGDPIYHGLVAGARMNGCRVVRWPLLHEGKATVDLQRLRDLFTAKTRAVIANFPHNPTGVTITDSQLRELVEIVSERDAYLVWDAAFAPLVYETAPLPDPSSLYDRVIVFGTLSKAYGAPGLRFGWCIAAPEVVDATIGLRDRTTLFVSTIVEFVAGCVLRSGDEFIRRRLENARGNRAIVGAWIAQESDKISWSLPAGGVCGFPELKEIDVARFCRDLVQTEETILVPGSAFGHSQHVRLGFGGERDSLIEGLARVSHAFQQW
jgi:capreomycidine synthase